MISGWFENTQQKKILTVEFQQQSTAPRACHHHNEEEEFSCPWFIHECESREHYSIRGVCLTSKHKCDFGKFCWQQNSQEHSPKLSEQPNIGEILSFLTFFEMSHFGHFLTMMKTISDVVLECGVSQLSENIFWPLRFFWFSVTLQRSLWNVELLTFPKMISEKSESCECSVIGELPRNFEIRSILPQKVRSLVGLTWNWWFQCPVSAWLVSFVISTSPHFCFRITTFQVFLLEGGSGESSLCFSS